MIYVLDASALMAVISGERGAERVLAADRGSEISIVNVSEVMTTVVERGGDPWIVTRLLEDMGLRTRSFREWHAIEVAKLRPATKPFGLGFGDRACLAQGRASGRPVLTGDHDWAKLDIGIEIELFREKR